MEEEAPGALAAILGEEGQVGDADLSGCLDTIPHPDPGHSVARPISDGRIPPISPDPAVRRDP
jgi:hypothetical protein